MNSIPSVRFDGQEQTGNSSPSSSSRPGFGDIVDRFLADRLWSHLLRRRPRLWRLGTDIARVWHEDRPEMVERYTPLVWCDILHTTPGKLASDLAYLRSVGVIEADGMRVCWCAKEETQAAVPAAVPETNGTANGHRRRRESDDAYNARRRSERDASVNGGVNAESSARSGGEESAPPEADGGENGVRPSLTPELTPAATHAGADKAKSPDSNSNFENSKYILSSDSNSDFEGAPLTTVELLMAEGMDRELAEGRVREFTEELCRDWLEAADYLPKPIPQGQRAGWIVNNLRNKKPLPKAMIEAREKRKRAEMAEQDQQRMTMLGMVHGARSGGMEKIDTATPPPGFFDKNRPIARGDGKEKTG